MVASKVATKIMTGLQKRLVKMDELIDKLEKSPSSSLLDKTHDFFTSSIYIFENVVVKFESFLHSY